MKACVFVKPVHHPAFAVNVSPGGTLEAGSGSTPISNPLDEYALEMALSLRDGPGPSCVTVTLCSAGTRTNSEQILRDLLACGADQALWIDAPEEPDGEVLVRHLVHAFQLHRFDLALFGVSDTDTEAGQAGPMFSALTGIPYLGSVVALRPGNKNASLEITRKEGRLREEIRVELPVCLGVLRGSPLRYPSFWGKRRANRMEISSLCIPPHPPRIERRKISGAKPRRSSGNPEYTSTSSAERIRQALGVSPQKAPSENQIRGTPEQTARRILEALEREKLLRQEPPGTGEDPG